PWRGRLHVSPCDSAELRRHAPRPSPRWPASHELAKFPVKRSLTVHRVESFRLSASQCNLLEASDEEALLLKPSADCPLVAAFDGVWLDDRERALSGHVPPTPPPSLACMP